MASVDVPFRHKRTDDMLDHMLKLRKREQKTVAKHEAQRAETQWICEYVATMALTMQHSPREAREAACAEIIATLRDAGIWPPIEVIPDELPPTEG